MALFDNLGGAARGFIIGGVVAVAAAGTAAALLVSSGKADEVNLTSASLVPEDASIYIGINNDLKSSQWVNAFAVAKKLGAEDPEKELMNSAEMADLDWEEDVVPFLGGDAALFVLSTDINVFEGGKFEGGVIFKAKDPGKAFKVLRREIVDREGAKLEKRGHAGVEYEADPADGGCLARIGDHLIVTSSEATMFAVIDASKDGKSLGASQDFRNLRDDLTRSFIAFSYVNPKRFVDNAIFGDDETRKVLERAGAGNVATSPFGGVFTASKGSFRIEQASKSTGDGNGTWAQPRTSRLIDLVPANAAFFGSTATVPGWWDQYSPESRRAIEDSLGSQDIFDLDDLKNVDELVAVLSGEIAGAAWFEDGDPDGVFLAEVADEAKALALFVKLMREDSPRAAVSKRTVNGVEVTLVGDNAAAVSKGVAYAGSLTGVTTVLTAKSGSLKGSAALAHSTSALGAPLGSFLFIDINAVIAGSGADSGFGFFAPPDALDAFILNIVNNGGFARFGAAVTVKE